MVIAQEGRLHVIDDEGVGRLLILSAQRVPQKWIRFCDQNALQLSDSRARFNDQAIPSDRIVL